MSEVPLKGLPGWLHRTSERGRVHFRATSVTVNYRTLCVARGCEALGKICCAQICNPSRAFINSPDNILLPLRHASPPS